MAELSELIVKFDRILKMPDAEQRASITSMADEVARKAAALRGDQSAKLSRLAEMLSFIGVIGYADRQEAIQVCVNGMREIVSQARG